MSANLPSSAPSRLQFFLTAKATEAWKVPPSVQRPSLQLKSHTRKALVPSRLGAGGLGEVGGRD